VPIFAVWEKVTFLTPTLSDMLRAKLVMT